MGFPTFRFFRDLRSVAPKAFSVTTPVGVVQGSQRGPRGSDVTCSPRRSNNPGPGLLRRFLKKRKVKNPIGGGSPEREKPVPLFSEALQRRPEARTREWRWPKRRREGGVKAPPWQRGRILQRGRSP
jgi:hypothetical protein